MPSNLSEALNTNRHRKIMKEAACATNFINGLRRIFPSWKSKAKEVLFTTNKQMHIFIKYLLGRKYRPITLNLWLESYNNSFAQVLETIYSSDVMLRVCFYTDYLENSLQMTALFLFHFLRVF